MSKCVSAHVLVFMHGWEALFAVRGEKGEGKPSGKSCQEGEGEKQEREKERVDDNAGREMTVVWKIRKPCANSSTSTDLICVRRSQGVAVGKQTTKLGQGARRGGDASQAKSPFSTSSSSGRQQGGSKGWKPWWAASAVVALPAGVFALQVMNAIMSVAARC